MDVEPSGSFLLKYGFESTYKELKQYKSKEGIKEIKGFESTYKELKLLNEFSCFLIEIVLSLPIRN